MTKQTHVEVASVDVDDYLVGWENEEDSDDSVGSLIVMFAPNVTDVSAVGLGNHIEVWEGYTTSTDTKRFDGYIVKKESEGNNLKLTCKNKLWLTTRLTANKVYLDSDATGGQISEIVKDLFATYTNISYDDTTIIATLVSTNLKKFVCNRAYIFTRVAELAEVVDYQFYYKASDDKAHFEPSGSRINTNVVYSGGANNCTAMPIKWKDDVFTMVNKAIVLGAEQYGRETELFNGTGSEDTFTLAKTPNDVHVWEDVGGVWVERIFGREDATSGTFDYYVDKENKQVIFVDNIPASGSGNVKIEYSRMIPIPVVVDNETSQELYGFVSEEVITKSDIRDVTDAEKRAIKYVSTYSDAEYSTEIYIKMDKIQSLDIQLGDTITVQDNVNVMTRDVVVKTITSYYPERPLKVTVGNRVTKDDDWFKDVLSRLKKLEEKELENEDVVLNVKQVGADVPLKRRYLNIQTRNIGTAFIMNHPTSGKLGTSKLGSGTMGSWVNARINHGGNCYSERFYDTTFIDAANTNAKISTTARTATFSVGSVFQSSIAVMTGTAITHAKIVAVYSGTYSFQVKTSSAGTFQTLTEDTKTALAATGTGLWLKVRCGSAGVVTDVKTYYYNE